MDLRARILQAAVERLATVGYNGLTITAVAARAGVSRPTVYSAFGSRENLASEAMVIASTQALARITERVKGAVTAADYFVEMIVASVEEFRRVPALTQIALDRASGTVEAGDPFSPEALKLASSFLAPLVKLEPTLAGDLDEIAEMSSRMLLSLVMFDSEASRSSESLRAFLHRRLVPTLGLSAQGGPAAH